ncbi:MAG: DUF2384 domain-containing protein [Planctomycetes bacterium]|nr:DUF2384 domain-containing protein [Planctomycetota bacterium]
MRFHAREPWRDFAEHHVLAFAGADLTTPMIGVVLGAERRLFGIALSCGDRAIEQLALLLIDSDERAVAPMLTLTFQPRAALSFEARVLVRRAGFDDRVLPAFDSFSPHRAPRCARAKDLHLFAMVLEALQHTDDAGLLRPQQFDFRRGGRVLTIPLASNGSDAGRDPVRFTRVGGIQPRPVAKARRAGLVQTQDLPLVDEHWLAADPPLFFDIPGVRVPRVLVLADAASGRIVLRGDVGPDESPDLRQQLTELLSQPSHGQPRLPRRITCLSGCRYGELLRSLGEFGVITEHVDHDDRIDRMIAKMQERVAAFFGSAGEPPPAADLMNWKEARDTLAEQVLDAVPTRALASRLAQKAFFGDTKQYGALTAAGCTQHVQAYRDWFLTHYRSHPARRTVAERMLAGDLQPVERLLLRARIDARPGLYLVAGCRPPLVVLSDILSDYQVDLHDPELCGSALVNDVLPASIADAAGHRFLIPIGPRLPLPAAEKALLAIHILRRRGHYPSGNLSDLVRARPERLAMLWPWVMMEHEERAEARFARADREHQVATFAVADWPGLLATLCTWPEVHSSQLETDAPTWAWLPPAAARNAPVCLSRVADTLLAEGRARDVTAIRGPLEAIPGVTFVRVRPWEPEPGSEQMRRAREGWLSADMLGVAQQEFDQQLIEWLDQPHAILGRRTPRQLARTLAGKELVLQMIRGLPEPRLLRGVTVPRARLRRELGLDPGESG